MNESILIDGWATIIGSLATIAIIVTALGVLKPAEALKRIAALLGISILLMLIPGALVNLWLNMSLWQKITAAVVGLLILWGRRRRRRTKTHKLE